MTSKKRLEDDRTRRIVTHAISDLKALMYEYKMHRVIEISNQQLDLSFVLSVIDKHFKAALISDKPETLHDLVRPKPEKKLIPEYAGTRKKQSKIS